MKHCNTNQNQIFAYELNKGRQKYFKGLFAQINDKWRMRLLTPPHGQLTPQPKRDEARELLK
jgi:hypothetical protein